MREPPVFGKQMITIPEERQEEWEIAGGTGKNTDRSKA